MTSVADTARSHDELSYKKDDVIEVMRCNTERWFAHNSDGFLGCEFLSLAQIEVIIDIPFF
jgi:hypothetical protein